MPQSRDRRRAPEWCDDAVSLGAAIVGALGTVVALAVLAWSGLALL